MLSNTNSETTSVHRFQFIIFDISMSTTELNRFTVCIADPSHHFIFESDMTGEQLICFSKFQKVFLIDHGILLYDDEVDRARGSQKRSQVWRSILTLSTTEFE